MTSEAGKRPKVVGSFIRQRRESLGLSQRALGLVFSPPVTTQFISNVERGVTPLPPAHVPILARALQVSEAEIMDLLGREFNAKLSGRLGKTGDILHGETAQALAPQLFIANHDYDFMRTLYEAYQRADLKTRQAFKSAAETVLSVEAKTSISVE